MKSAVPEGQFRILAPATPGPLVFAAPHAGRRVPDELAEAARVDVRALRELEDPLVDRMIEDAAGQGASILICDVARAFVDVNRDPGELDPRLVEGAAASSARISAGLGVIPRLIAEGRPIHRRRLSLDEARAWVAATHAPYHAALARMMEETRRRHGIAVLVDWHSMPSRASEAEGRRSGRRPDVVLGDLHGRACDARISGRVRAVLEAHGLSTVLNRPYAGGFVTQSWGRPNEGYHALQVEIDRSLYLDERTLEPNEGLERLKGVALAVTEALLGLLEQTRTTAA